MVIGVDLPAILSAKYEELLGVLGEEVDAVGDLLDEELDHEEGFDLEELFVIRELLALLDLIEAVPDPVLLGHDLIF